MGAGRGTNGELEALIAAHVGEFDEDGAARAAAARDPSVPRVTVITPSFNQGRFIERTIRSVLNQGWRNLEYMIVDGASDDGTPETVRRYERYLAWWVTEPDSGQADAIGKALARATGKYVTWVCSDDILMPRALETMVRLLESRPDAGVVYGKVVFIDEEDRVVKLQSFPDVTRDMLLYHKHSTFAQPSSLMRSDILEQAGGL
ncbi:MAG: glycosyltransferase family 2 protein, partial [Gemmatimonadota bacterium]